MTLHNHKSVLTQAVRKSEFFFHKFPSQNVRRNFANWVTILKVSAVIQRRHKYLCCHRSLILLFWFLARWTHETTANVFQPTHPLTPHICFDFDSSTYVLLNISKSLILLILEFLRNRLICNMNERCGREIIVIRKFIFVNESQHTNTWNECGVNRRQLEHVCSLKAWSKRRQGSRAEDERNERMNIYCV